MPNIPRIVCLCGSTRFMDAYHAANRERSLRGEIVLTVEIATYDGNTDPQGHDPELKRRLDELHFHKIELADYILVLNVGGYIGESTRREIQHARSLGKPVEYLETATWPDLFAGKPPCKRCGGTGRTDRPTLTGRGPCPACQ